MKPDLVLIVKEFFPRQLHSKSGFIFYNILIREYIIQYQDMKDTLQQSYRNIALSLSLTEIGQLFKMDYSAERGIRGQVSTFDITYSNTKNE
jgi:hypothetical protein